MRLAFSEGQVALDAGTGEDAQAFALRRAAQRDDITVAFTPRTCPSRSKRVRLGLRAVRHRRRRAPPRRQSRTARMTWTTSTCSCRSVCPTSDRVFVDHLSPAGLPDLRRSDLALTPADLRRCWSPTAWARPTSWQAVDGCVPASHRVSGNGPHRHGLGARDHPSLRVNRGGHARCWIRAQCARPRVRINRAAPVRARRRSGPHTGAVLPRGPHPGEG
ncbi:hypothetical protein QJS66_14400 [Kocuria rhizophila]|nr:hypothetical protein QJS66_14400 [Kocuria rhizophila]